MLEGREVASRRAWTGLRVSLSNLRKAKYKVPHLGLNSPKHRERLGIEWLGSSPEKKELRVLMDKKQHEPDVCPESHLHPGLHPKQSGSR